MLLTVRLQKLGNYRQKLNIIMEFDGSEWNVNKVTEKIISMREI